MMIVMMSQSWDIITIIMSKCELDLFNTIGAIVVEQKYFTCPSRESNPGRWIYSQTLSYVTVKTGFYRKIYIYIDPVTGEDVITHRS